MNNILIIGYGVVGHNIEKLFESQCVNIYDPSIGINNKYISGNGGIKSGNIEDFDGQHFYVGFICVPTDKMNDGSCNTSIVESSIMQWRNHCEVLCIRSTVPPGFTHNYKDDCIFQPEYYGATQHANDNKYDFIILGGKTDLTNKVAEVYKEIFTGDLRILITDSRTAELCKYMENSWLATKVTFCNEWFRLAEKMGVNYDELRELWLADPRINRSHTFVYRDRSYYDSHCLNKDIPAIIKEAKKADHEMNLLRTVFNVNELHKHDAS